MAFLHFLKTIFVPLLFAALLYVVTIYLILPFIRRHRLQTRHYLPLSLSPDSLAPATSTFRSRLTAGLTSLFIPSRFQPQHRRIESSGEDSLFDDEEGEGMVGFGPLEGEERRREALEEARRVGGRVEQEQRRLSRELEEGFRDESEGESEEDEDVRRRRSLSVERGRRVY